VLELICQLRRQQLVGVDDPGRIGMHPEQPVPFDCRQAQQPVALFVDGTEVISLREPDQRTVRTVSPVVERAREASGRAPLVGHDPYATVSAGVHHRDKRSISGAGRDDRKSDIVEGHERARLRKVPRETDDLRMAGEELSSFPHGQIRVGVHRRWVPPHATGVDVHTAV
jgi:hypothetical protein